MTLSKFKRYCEQKQPHIITYNDENDREHTAAGGNTNHFEALRLVLAFDSVTVEYNPNVIYFKGDCGVMYINNVQSVSVNGRCMLGDIVTVTAETSNGQRQYTFLSNDKTTGSNMTMMQAISTLTSEHYANLTAFKEGFTYDTVEVQGDSNIEWKNVLAVYAVKTTTSEDNAFEVVTINEEKLDLLRGIMSDMNKLTGVVTPKVVAQTVVTTDEEGNSVKTTEYVTKKVLTVNIIRLSAEHIIELYNFNDEQKKQLNELMSDDYTELWNELIGGSGEIIMSGSSWISKGYFTWPLPDTYTITSYFGTRTDPISGEVKTHGGTDIAAPGGTPILAAADGTVVVASYDADGYGFYVKIKHDDTYSTIYAHCSVLLVSAGQTVKQGQIIAKVGSTGYSTGNHLHYEVIQNGTRVDALNFYE